MTAKKFSSALSCNTNLFDAINQVAAKVHQDLGGDGCDLVVLYLSEGYAQFDPIELVDYITDKFKCKHLIACNSSGVLGDQKEIEMEPAISVLAMNIPGIKVVPFSMTEQELAITDNGEALIKRLDLYPTENPKFICLADPAGCDVSKFMTLFNEAYEDAPIVGGLASGIVVGADNWLALDGDVYDEGVVGLALCGDIDFEIVVSQGCRPIGEPLIITKSDKNILFELAGQSALDILGGVYDSLNKEDRELAKQSLFVGIVMNEQRPHFRRGDFLIRNILGVDHQQKAIAVGDLISPGQTLQFQLRDARAAEEDLESLLHRSTMNAKAPAEGAMLVTCCGRGKGLFKESDHDVRMIQEMRGPMPMTGFFANGEFGRIDQKNYIHGYTSSLTIFK